MGIREALLADAAAAHIGERRSGTTYYDSTGSRNGTLGGGYAWKSPGGNSSHYVDFDGTGYANIGGRVLTSTTEWTLSAWLRVDGGTGPRVAVANGDPGANGFAIYCDTSGFLRGLLGGVAAVGAYAAATGTWYQVMFTRGSGTTTLFVGGVSTSSSTGSPIAPSDYAVVGANKSLAQNWNGGIAEVLWLPRRATASEIAWLADPANSLLSADSGSIRIPTRTRSRLSLRL